MNALQLPKRKKKFPARKKNKLIKTQGVVTTPLGSPRVKIESLAVSEPTEKKKVPRRILHFSDGILEEYSTDEDEVAASNEAPVDVVSWH
jgi:hypothetical protein